MIDPAIFGSFGGGGRSGSFTFGSDGRSGRFGSDGIPGITKNPGNDAQAVRSPREREGKLGSLIGEIRGSKFGNEILIPKRTSERSKMISGHFGNLITGIEGKSIDKSLNFQY